MRTPKKISFSLTTQFKTKLLTWANQFEEVIWLDSNNYEFSSNEYEAILAVEAFTALKTDYVNAFDKLQEYQHTTKDWIFGYLTYDLKNNVEALSSKNDDGLAFPDLYFFQPKKIFLLKAEEVEMHYLGMVDDEMEEDWQAILNTSVTSKAETENNTSSIESRLTKAEYMERVGKMLSHIHRGDIYEANFCQEFYAEDFPLQPLQTYFDLNSISEPPFAAFLKLEEFHLLSASPERYLKKTGNKVISQPIKGTAKRLEDVSEDEVLSLKDGSKQTQTTRLGLQVRFTNAENGTYFVGSGLGEANTVKTQEGLLGLDLEEINFRQSAIGVTTRKALETASARIVARMIRKGIFEN